MGDVLEEIFIFYFVEFCDCIICVGLVVIVVFFGFVYWVLDIFKLFVWLLMDNLLKDGKMIVIDVIGLFFVLMKVMMFVVFVIVLLIVLY